MFYNWWKNCIYETCYNAVFGIQTPYWCSHCQTIFEKENGKKHLFAEAGRCPSSEPTAKAKKRNSKKCRGREI